MEEITRRLYELSDEKYADFQAKLTPTVPRGLFIGVRVPLVRKLAKEIAGTREAADFLAELPHRFYDENVLHSLLLSEIKDVSACIAAIDRFLPFADNWAVCDLLSPKCFRKRRSELIEQIPRWIRDPATYTHRFGVNMLMGHFLDRDFRPEYLEWPLAIRAEDYYTRMSVAWFYATALTKQWDAALPYLTENRMDSLTHNKTIQKARESLRIPQDKKDFLLTLKR